MELEPNAEWGVIKKYLYSLLPDLTAFLTTIILAVVVYFIGTRIIKFLMKTYDRWAERKEVDEGVIEAAKSMGAGTWTIIFRVLLVEARISLIVGMTIALGTILGYSAMAGVIGGGGLGDIAIRYGYYRYESEIMIVTIIILVIIVQVLQALGMMISKKLDRRNK